MPTGLGSRPTFSCSHPSLYRESLVGHFTKHFAVRDFFQWPDAKACFFAASPILSLIILNRYKRPYFVRRPVRRLRRWVAEQDGVINRGPLIPGTLASKPRRIFRHQNASDQD